ncbi:MAG: DUF5666 domain-containing protein [Candidatus Acidiferrum sp.]
MCAAASFVGSASTAAAGRPGLSQAAAAQAGAVHPVGTVKAISGKTITLTTETGDVIVQVQDDARLLRITPDQKDLKNAVPLDLKDLQTGDRILVRGKLGDDGKTVLAASVIAIKQADIATKQAHEREEWQRHGVGGLVTKLDAASGTITISTNAVGAAKDVTVHISKDTILRRYATDSVKFDDAKIAPIEQIKNGDQLRARGTRSADGAELTADEVVSGTFRNVAGTINAVDTAANTITVMDLITKKPLTIKVTSDTQLRKLQPQMAQMIAMRLKGGATDAGASGGGASGSSGSSATPAAKPADGSAAAQGSAGGQGSQSGQGAAGGTGGAAGRPGGAARGGDMQQILSRMPAATLAELQKGDAVMIVTTEGTQSSGATAITLLAGVETILQASPQASGILTPWSLSGAPAGGDVAP